MDIYIMCILKNSMGGNGTLVHVEVKHFIWTIYNIHVFIVKSLSVL